ncbi:MAG: TRAP transporter TatT component family protein [Chromatiales bacterium]|nr:TRAP transporter TatT component family protein [Chromatiales bacterium]
MAINTVGNALAEIRVELRGRRRPGADRRRPPVRPQDDRGPADESPRSTRGCCWRACSGFTQYAYAFVQQEADYRRGEGPRAGDRAARARARSSTCARAATACAGSRWTSRASARRSREDPDAALAKTTKDARPAALLDRRGVGARAIALDVTDSDADGRPDRSSRRSMRRALALDEGWEQRLASTTSSSRWEAAHAVGRRVGRDGRASTTRGAVALAGGQRAVAATCRFAETRARSRSRTEGEFEALLNEALAVDVEPARRADASPTVLAQRRARWLLGRARRALHRVDRTTLRRGSAD